MFKSILSLLFISLYLSINAFSQPQNSIGEEKIASAKLEIQKQIPEISDVVLQSDIKKISSNYGEINNQLMMQKSLTEKEAAEAITAGWKYVRIDSPLQNSKSLVALSFKEFMVEDFFVENAMVKFTSSPADADVFVSGNDDRLCQTNDIRFYKVNYMIKVVFKKEGFKDCQKHCWVERNKSNLCDCQLESL